MQQHPDPTMDVPNARSNAALYNGLLGFATRSMLDLIVNRCAPVKAAAHAVFALAYERVVAVYARMQEFWPSSPLSA
jgi:hypothetical protein